MAWHGMARHKLSTSILWSICRDEFLKNNYFLLLNQRHIHEKILIIKKKKTEKDKNINSKKLFNLFNINDSYKDEFISNLNVQLV